MKKREFENIMDELVDGLEIVIRYFTYNKNEYVDILGTVDNIYGIGLDPYFEHRYYFTIMVNDILNYADGFDENTYPDLKTFKNQDKEFLNVYSDHAIFIKKANLRAYKLNKLKNKMGGI